MAAILRMEGLALTAGSQDIRNFFPELNIPFGGVEIHGGPSNIAFVCFASDSELLKALDQNGQTILGMPVKLLLDTIEESGAFRAGISPWTPRTILGPTAIKDHAPPVSSPIEHSLHTSSKDTSRTDFAAPRQEAYTYDGYHTAQMKSSIEQVDIRPEMTQWDTSERSYSHTQRYPASGGSLSEQSHTGSQSRITATKGDGVNANVPNIHDLKRASHEHHYRIKPHHNSRVEKTQPKRSRSHERNKSAAINHQRHASGLSDMKQGTHKSHLKNKRDRSQSPDRSRKDGSKSYDYSRNQVRDIWGDGAKFLESKHTERKRSVDHSRGDNKNVTTSGVHEKKRRTESESVKGKNRIDQKRLGHKSPDIKDCNRMNTAKTNVSKKMDVSDINLGSKTNYSAGKKQQTNDSASKPSDSGNLRCESKPIDKVMDSKQSDNIRPESKPTNMVTDSKRSDDIRHKIKPIITVVHDRRHSADRKRSKPINKVMDSKHSLNIKCESKPISTVRDSKRPVDRKRESKPIDGATDSERSDNIRHENKPISNVMYSKRSDDIAVKVHTTIDPKLGQIPYQNLASSSCPGSVAVSNQVSGYGNHQLSSTIPHPVPHTQPETPGNAPHWVPNDAQTHAPPVVQYQPPSQGPYPGLGNSHLKQLPVGNVPHSILDRAHLQLSGAGPPYPLPQFGHPQLQGGGPYPVLPYAHPHLRANVPYPAPQFIRPELRGIVPFLAPLNTQPVLPGGGSHPGPANANHQAPGNAIFPRPVSMHHQAPNNSTPLQLGSQNVPDQVTFSNKLQPSAQSGNVGTVGNAVVSDKQGIALGPHQLASDKVNPCSRYITISNVPHLITEKEVIDLFRGFDIAQILVIENEKKNQLFIKFVTFQPTDNFLERHGPQGKRFVMKIISESFFQSISLRLELQKHDMHFKREKGKVYYLGAWNDLVENFDNSCFVRILIKNPKSTMTGAAIKKLYGGCSISKGYINDMCSSVIVHAQFANPPRNIKNIDIDEMTVRAVFISEDCFKSVEESMKRNSQPKLESTWIAQGEPGQASYRSAGNPTTSEEQLAKDPRTIITHAADSQSRGDLNDLGEGNVLKEASKNPQNAPWNKLKPAPWNTLKTAPWNTLKTAPWNKSKPPGNAFQDAPKAGLQLAPWNNRQKVSVTASGEGRTLEQAN